MAMTDGSGQASTSKTVAKAIVAILGILLISTFYYLWAVRELAADYFFYAVVVIVIAISSTFAWLSRKK